MTNRIAAIILAAFALTTGTAFAQTMESTPAPKPAKPNFAPFKFMLGTWSCSTKSARRPGPYLTTTSYSLDSSGYWLIAKSVQKPVAWFPYPASGVDKITYDADTARWMDVADGDFGYYDLSTSKGWSGSTIVWHDLAFAGGKDVTSQSDLTITKVSATKMTSTSTFGTAKRKSIGVVGTCTKTMAAM